MGLIGWDIGGAHLKGARVENGRVVAAVQVPCPLWKGLDQLDLAFAQGRQRLGDAPVHAVTMTGELSDVFASRAEGVVRLTAIAQAHLTGAIRLYAGALGWLPPEGADTQAERIASANWHASASAAALASPDALFADMGSTTTDLIPISAGRVAARGGSDAERLLAGELVYSGATRTFLMAVAQRVPFRGAWTPVMNEYFASTADVHRVLGTLPEAIDMLPAADNRDKTVAASRARLARSIGRDPDEAQPDAWRSLAAYFAEAQLRAVHDAALQVLSAAPLQEAAPIVAAGTGRFILARLAARLGRRLAHWEDGVDAPPELRSTISDCAPAAAVALLLAAAQAP